MKRVFVILYVFKSKEMRKTRHLFLQTKQTTFFASQQFKQIHHKLTIFQLKIILCTYESEQDHRNKSNCFTILYIDVISFTST